MSDEIHVHTSNLKPLIRFRSIRQHLIGTILDTLLNEGVLFSWAFLVRGPYRRVEFQLYFEQDAMITLSMKEIEVLLLGMYVANPRKGSDHLLMRGRMGSRLEEAG